MDITIHNPNIRVSRYNRNMVTGRNNVCLELKKSGSEYVELILFNLPSDQLELLIAGFSDDQSINHERRNADVEAA